MPSEILIFSFHHAVIDIDTNRHTGYTIDQHETNKIASVN